MSHGLGEGVAVALSTSFFGFYTHAGFMAELHEAGIEPDQVAGTSAGALIAVVCGSGRKGAELIDFVLEPGLRRSFFDVGALWRAPGVILSLHGSGAFSGDNFVRFLRARLGNPKLESFTQPRVQVAVTDLDRRESMVVSTGDASEWTAASCAVPGLFRHREIGGRRWCDGGVAMFLPFEHWLDDPSIHTIILHRVEAVRGEGSAPRRPTLASGYAASHDTVCGVTTALRLRLAEMKGKRVIDIHTPPPRSGLFPHKTRAGMIAAGRDAGRRAVAQFTRNAVPAAG